MLQSWNPDHIDPTMAKPARKKQTKKAANNKHNGIMRMISSAFTMKLGKTSTANTAAKRKLDAEDHISSSIRKSKRISRSASSSKSYEPSTLGFKADIAPMDITFSEESLAPPHRPMPPSILSVSYRRLSASQMVRLSVNDEIIIVIPQLTAKTPAICRPSILELERSIDSVLLKSCTLITPSEKNEQLTVIKNRHRIQRGAVFVYEYPARIINYTKFKETFPYSHAIFAILVSSRSFQVDLANGFDLSFDESISDDEDNPDELELHQRERCILEYFLCLIRIHSQKRLQYWAMLTPMGYYSRGYKQPGGKCKYELHQLKETNQLSFSFVAILVLHNTHKHGYSRVPGNMQFKAVPSRR